MQVRYTLAGKTVKDLLWGRKYPSDGERGFLLTHKRDRRLRLKFPA